MPESNLPPPPFVGVVSFSSSAVIDAPIEKVWEILLDFPSYAEWNGFVHKQTIVDGSSKQPLPDQTPREGQYLLMEVHIPPKSDTHHAPTSRPLEIISAVDPAAHRIAWRNLLPQWLIKAERWQALSVVEGGKTLYETREDMGGPGAYAVRWFMKGGLQEGFQAVADGLKRRAEELRG